MTALTLVRGILLGVSLSRHLSRPFLDSSVMLGKVLKKDKKKTGLETFAEGAGKQLRKVNWWVAGFMTPNSNEAIEFSYCI